MPQMQLRRGQELGRPLLSLSILEVCSLEKSWDKRQLMNGPACINAWMFCSRCSGSNDTLL
jgi:hypothetical protein